MKQRSVKFYLAVLSGLLVVVGAGLWLVGPEWRAFLRHPPTNTDILFWTQPERDAAFRLMDRLPVLAQSRRTATGAVRTLEEGEPLTLDIDLDRYMSQQRHAALIVLQDGRVRLERYGLDFRPDGRWTSFSVAKSFTSTLVGMAIVDGYIESLYVSVADYIPGLRGSAYEDVTVAQLLTMSSGIAWNEDYGDPNSDVARFSQHVTADDMPAVVSYMRGLARAHPAGEVWNYSTGETNLIGILVSAATGQKLTDYLSSRIWERIGMQQSGTWILGPDGHEISGCCIQAAAMDFARFGQFMLEGGVVDGEALLPPGWIATATTKQIGVRPGRGYGFQWWTYDDGSFAARGIFGQGIFINPQRRLVIATNSNWDSAVGQDSGQNPRREEFYREVMSALDAEEALHDGD